MNSKIKNLQKYRKKQEQIIIAVQLDLDTKGFSYEKWDSKQFCKQGDWLVNNNGETYTVDQDSFRNTYREISKGLYQKPSIVWAEIAKNEGFISTKEGKSAYKPGDYLVYNDETGADKYCVSKNIFEEIYELE